MSDINYKQPRSRPSEETRAGRTYQDSDEYHGTSYSSHDDERTPLLSRDVKASPKEHTGHCSALTVVLLVAFILSAIANVVVLAIFLSRRSKTTSIASQLYWDSLHTMRCVKYETQEYAARLLNGTSVEGFDMYQACQRKPLHLHGTFVYPDRCEYHGVPAELYGYWNVDEESQCHTAWADFKSLDCTAPQSGLRRFEARLQTSEDGDKIALCSTTSVKIRDVVFEKPAKCEDRGSKGMYGLWDAPHESCGYPMLYWDWPVAGNCFGYGVQEFSARLLNTTLAEGIDMVRACRNTRLSLGSVNAAPERCDDRGGKDGVWGIWRIDGQSPCHTRWVDTQDMGCTAPRSGFRHYEARLWQIHPGDRHLLCASTEQRIKGYWFSGGTYCQDRGDAGMYGGWDVEEYWCSQD